MANPPPQPLAYRVVSDLFDLLAVRYGHLFLGRWSGIELEAVKEDWRQQLAGVSGSQLQYAVDNLGEEPPANVAAFRKLAKSMPDERRMAQHVLPPPEPKAGVPTTMREAFQRLAAPRDEPAHITQGRDYLAKWAAEAQKPEGERVNPTQLQRDTLAHWARVVSQYDARQRSDPAKEAADAQRAEQLAAAAPPPPLEERLTPTR